MSRPKRVHVLMGNDFPVRVYADETQALREATRLNAEEATRLKAGQAGYVLRVLHHVQTVPIVEG